MKIVLVHGFGERAKELEREIEGFTNGERVPVIAHSGGGKDARLLASPQGELRRDDLISFIEPRDFLLGRPFPHLEFYETLVANLGAVRR